MSKQWPDNFGERISEMLESEYILASGMPELTQLYFENYPAGTVAYNTLYWVMPFAPSAPFLSSVRRRLVGRCKRLVDQGNYQELRASLAMTLDWLGYCCLVLEPEKEDLGRTVSDSDLAVHFLRTSIEFSTLEELVGYIGPLADHESVPVDLQFEAKAIRESISNAKGTASRKDCLHRSGQKLRALSAILIASQ